MRAGCVPGLVAALVFLFSAAPKGAAADDGTVAVSPSASPVAGSTPAASPGGSPGAKSSASAKPKSLNPDAWAEARSIFEQFSPDQKKKFLDNLNQWKAMSPEEQELYRDRELFRREKIAEEIQDAITKSGLKLDEDQREVFALRYTQERRKIEDALHKETDQERQTMVSEMMGRLKGEFSSATPLPMARDGSSQ
jgi:dsDNA-binding SOS-regulon protein